MSSNWSQAGQPHMGGISMQQSSTPTRRGTNPPPVCFNCGGEHFLVDCPASRTSNTGFAPPAAVPYQQASGPAPPSQQYPQAGQSHYSSYAPNQQYNPPAAQYQYNQPAQPYAAPAPAPTGYVAPPSNPQYSRLGYQPPPYNQGNGASQYTAAPYQPPNPQYNARGPAPYQAPVNNYQTRNNGYGNGYQSAPTSGPYQPPPTQWNGSPPAPSQAPSTKPRNNGNFQRDFSATPSQSSQKQQYRQPARSQSLQLEHPVKTPQTPSSQVFQGSPPKLPTTSVSSTPASSSDIRRESSATNNLVNAKTEIKIASEKDKVKETSEQETEEGEVCEGDEEEELFEWDFEQIFKEPPAAETVALAQPLSAGYESTPVPLIQAWTTSIPSISRYARKDNLKEFIKSVRVAPQWSYLQEDPAFAEVSDGEESIPLETIGVWMDIHHGRVDEDGGELTSKEGAEELELISKKRSRGESDAREEGEDQQEDVDHQIPLEISTEPKDAEPPNKRQKNDDDMDDHDQIMQSSGGRTPIIMGRGGTPCLATTDDAWAPQPGETAASPADPTESLLASLGVSGDPKPRKQASVPPPVAKDEQSHSPTQTQTQGSVPPQPQSQGPNPQASGLTVQTGPQNGNPTAYAPQNGAQYGASTMPYTNGPPSNVPYSQGLQPNAPQGLPQTYQTYNQGPPQGYNQGYPQGYPQGPPQGPSQIPPQVSQGNPQYGPVTNVPYGNGSQSMQGATQYGPSVNVPPNNYPSGQQWGPQRNMSYGAVPPYAPQQYPPSAPNPGYGNANYGPPVNQYQAAAPAQYPQGPQGSSVPPQYNQARQPSYGSGPPMAGQYGPMAQNSPIQYGPAQYGPPQNAPYNVGYPNQPQYQNGSVNGFGSGPPQGPPNNAPYANMPPNPNMPPNYNMPPNQMQYGNMPNGNMPNGNMPNGNMPHGNMPNGNMPNGNMPNGNMPNGNMPNGNLPNGTTYNGNAPPRQDSGYVSARGSYSNASGPNAFSNQAVPQSYAFPNSEPVQGQPFLDATNQQSPQSRTQGSESTAKAEKPVKAEKSMRAEGSENSNASLTSNENATSSSGSPLSPTSAMILSDLGGSSKKSKTSRPSLPRKVKQPPKPQPVVQEAYSRRW